MPGGGFLIIKNFDVAFAFRSAAVAVLGGAAVMTGTVSADDTSAQQQEVTPEQVYYFACAQCHQTGLNAAPKYRGSRAWESIIEQGREVVYRNTLEGKGAMPPRGGKPELTEEQVKMAVDYMVEGAGGWPDES